MLSSTDLGMKDIEVAVAMTSMAGPAVVQERERLLSRLERIGAEYSRFRTRKNKARLRSAYVDFLQFLIPYTKTH